MQKCVAALCAALVVLASPAAAGRTLLQAKNTYNVFPGCTFLTDSPVFKSPNFSYFQTALQQTGLNNTLTNLTSPVTLFAPTNAAVQDFAQFSNITLAQLLASPELKTILLYHVSPQIYTNETVFKEGAELTTLAGPGYNLTIALGNGTLAGTNVPSISVISYGSEALIQPGSGQACNVIYYPIDAVLVPPGALDISSPSFVPYLEDLLRPGGPETPASLIFDAVSRNQTTKVATAFEEAQSVGYGSEVQMLCDAVTVLPGGTATILPVLNQLAKDGGCSATTVCLNGVYGALGNTQTTVNNLKTASQTNYPAFNGCLGSASQ